MGEAIVKRNPYRSHDVVGHIAPYRCLGSPYI